MATTIESCFPPIVSGEEKFSGIMIHNVAWYEKNKIKLITGTRVTDINRKQKTVQLNNGKSIDYDKLIIATGSNPFIPPISGVSAKNVIAFRTIKDVEEMLEATKDKRHVAVIGGGVSGLEVAYGLKKQGMNVTVIHRAAHIMNNQLDPLAASLFTK